MELEPRAALSRYRKALATSRKVGKNLKKASNKANRSLEVLNGFSKILLTFRRDFYNYLFYREDGGETEAMFYLKSFDLELAQDKV